MFLDGLALVIVFVVYFRVYVTGRLLKHSLQKTHRENIRGRGESQLVGVRFRLGSQPGRPLLGIHTGLQGTCIIGQEVFWLRTGTTKLSVGLEF